MASTGRRFGREDSETRAVLLDVAEKVMREDGYAAVTSRRVAARAGMKPSLVHYYFRTIDDLFLALLRERGRRHLERYEEVLTSSQPLHALWALSSDPAITTAISEFMALANHRKAIRAEIARHGERLRSIQVEILSRAFGERGAKEGVLPPVVMAVFMEGISRTLVMEESLGISSGHRESLAVVEQYLKKLEGPRKRAARSRAA